MAMTLRISAKKLDNKVNYISFKEEMQTFTNAKERRVVEEKQKLSKVPILVSSSIIGSVPQVSLAATERPYPLSTDIPDILNPEVVFQWAWKLGLTGLGLAFGSTMLLLTLSAIRRQLGGEKNRRKSKEWNTDIIKGFSQALVAIPIAFALYYLATSLFGQLDIFTNSTFSNTP